MRPSLALLLLGWAGSGAAQRVEPSPPVDAPSVTEGDITEAHPGGLTVLVKRVPGAELVTATLFVRGGAHSWTAATAGIDTMALKSAAFGGTQTQDRAAFKDRLALQGIGVWFKATRGWSSVELTGPRRTAPQLAGILADLFLRPAMPEALVTRGRAATLTGLRAQRLSVGVRLSALMDELRFPDHPWRAPPQGTEATIAALEPGEVRAHLAGLREKARLLVVVVGDVEPGEVISQLDAQFGALPRGAGVGRAPLAPFTAAGVASEAGEQTTTRVRVLCRASHPASDGAASLVGSYLLWSRLFFRMPLADSTEYLWEMDATAGWAGFEFSSTRPAEALKAAWGQVRELQDRVFSEYDLATARTSSELRLLRARETTSEQAQGLGAALLDSGDWRIERRRLERLRTVSAEEVSAWATRCFANAKVVSVGPVQLEPADVPPW